MLAATVLEMDHPTGLEDLIAGADPGSRGGSEHGAAERRLMLAILVDAIIGFQRAVTGCSVKRRRQLLADERWILSDDRRWPFSFVNVCEALDIEPGALRRGLLRWRRTGVPSRGRSRKNLLGAPLALCAGAGAEHP
jgi:hypothetical protein